MAAFARARTAGRWLTGTPFLTAELELWDQNLEETINADAGGIWSPVARIVCGGAGWRIATDADLQDVQKIKLTSDALIEFRDAGKPLTRGVDDSDAHAPQVLPAGGGSKIPGWAVLCTATTRPVWASVQCGAPLVLRLRLPQRCSISSVTVTLGSATLATTTGPTTPSFVEIVRWSLTAAPTDKAIEVLAAGQDVWTSDAAYKLPHPVVVTPTAPIVRDPSYAYGVRVMSEDGVRASTVGVDPDEVNAHILQYMAACRVSVLIHALDPHVAG